jgi:hypothetical protein
LKICEAAVNVSSTARCLSSVSSFSVALPHTRRRCGAVSPPHSTRSGFAWRAASNADWSSVSGVSHWYSPHPRAASTLCAANSQRVSDSK